MALRLLSAACLCRPVRNLRPSSLGPRRTLASSTGSISVCNRYSPHASHRSGHVARAQIRVEKMNETNILMCKMCQMWSILSFIKIENENCRKIIITSILNIKKKHGSGQERELNMHASVNSVPESTCSFPLAPGNSVPCTAHLPPLAGGSRSV